MTRFRIYTETKDNLKEIVNTYFDSATFIEAKGLWNRTLENSTIIEIIELDDFWYHNSCAKVHNLVSRIKLDNKQEAVLVTEEKIRATLE